MGLKTTPCRCSQGKFWTKRYKEIKNKQPNCQFRRAWGAGLGADAWFCACPLHTQPPKKWASHVSHPSSQTLDTPTLTPYKEAAWSTSSASEEAREPVTRSHSPSPAAGPSIKPCLNFVSDL